MTENNDFNNIENDSHISRNEKRFKITDDGIIDTVRQKQYTKIKSSDNILDSISFTHLIEVVDLLNELNDENEQLKAQLYCPFDSICIQCNNEYLVQKGEYYVSRCKKGHEQCSKVDVKYCDDFELKGDFE